MLNCRVFQKSVFLMLILAISMVFMPLVQEAHARCDSERKAAADASDDWDVAVLAMTGAALLWGATCKNAKTTTQILACAGATVALIAAMKHEKNCKKRYEDANRAFEDCMRRTSGSNNN